jgi:hypothetical protein
LISNARRDYFEETLSLPAHLLRRAAQGLRGVRISLKNDSIFIYLLPCHLAVRRIASSNPTHSRNPNSFSARAVSGT